MAALDRICGHMFHFEFINSVMLKTLGDPQKFMNVFLVQCF